MDKEYKKYEYENVQCIELEGESEEELKQKMIDILLSQESEIQHSSIIRPNIKITKILTGLILPIAFYLTSIIMYIFLKEYYNIWLFIITLIIIFVFTIKNSFTLLVLLYQKFAPAKLRSSCRFSPSCSNYMLMSIEKYGFLKGFIKGIKRLCRCHYPNGGIDNP